MPVIASVHRWHVLRRFVCRCWHWQQRASTDRQTDVGMQLPHVHRQQAAYDRVSILQPLHYHLFYSSCNGKRRQAGPTGCIDWLRRRRRRRRGWLPRTTRTSVSVSVSVRRARLNMIWHPDDLLPSSALWFETNWLLYLASAIRWPLGHSATFLLRDIRKIFFPESLIGL